MQHPKVSSLIAYAEGLLSGKERAALDNHVESCSKCAAEASEWLGLLGLLKATPLESAPDDAVHNCMEIYKITEPASKRKDVCAEVVFDSQTEEAAVGVRGFADSQQIHLQTADADIHLCVAGLPRAIVGQLLARPGAGFVTGAQVELLHENESVEMTVTDALGEFRLGNVPSGRSRIQAHLPSGVRLIGSFTINAEDNEQ
jgi:anti-sigma factor RsiW